jgi:hypothetical protein
MTYEERLEAFKAELLDISEMYQIALVGTCESEGIYGEITFVDLANPEACGWFKVMDRLWNFD